MKMDMYIGAISGSTYALMIQNFSVNLGERKMKTRPIDANQLYRIEKLLDTDIVKKDKVASELLEQVLYDIQHVPTLTQPNEPLTIEQLREMDGEPVFVVIDDGIEPLKMWALVDYIAEEQCLTLTNNLGGRSQYYTADDLEIDHITVYRRPPEGEET
ncbi:hypothetical protein [Evtepia sp.]|uniref:hypothetical protein n=1 Tax=Evtepia sp. TaxID=2773933 RepID=UPI003990CCA8